MGSSYTWCNFYKLTHFLHHKDLMVKKTPLNAIVFHLITKLILVFSLSLFIVFHQNNIFFNAI